LRGVWQGCGTQKVGQICFFVNTWGLMITLAEFRIWGLWGWNWVFLGYLWGKSDMDLELKKNSQIYVFVNIKKPMIILAKFQIWGLWGVIRVLFWGTFGPTGTGGARSTLPDKFFLASCGWCFRAGAMGVLGKVGCKVLLRAPRLCPKLENFLELMKIDDIRLSIYNIMLN